MMRRAVMAALAAAFLSIHAFAQDPYTLAPQAYRNQLENDRVRVTRVHYAPNEKIAEHGHPVRPTIYIYLKDGGPVLFKHEHGISGELAATRAPIKAGAYRLAAGRDETHIVENRSEQASDFLQVEIKTPVDLKAFAARRSGGAVDRTQSSTTVEVDIAELRISRVVCTAGSDCAAGRSTSGRPALVVAFPTGETTWLPASGADPTIGHSTGEFLMIEFKTDS